MPALALPLGDEEAPWTHLGNNSEIQAIYRHGDSLWIGTNGGLLIYDLIDGEFTAKYLIGPRLPSNSIYAITGRGDTVLVGTDRGLSVFTEKGVYHYEASLNPSLRDIRSIDFGPAGEICYGTRGHGAGIMQGDTIFVVTRIDSLLDDSVFGVIKMDDTTYYYATALGLCAFRDSLWVSFRAGAGLPKGEVRDLLLTEDFAMYALIPSKGVYYFDGVRGRRISPRGLFPYDEIAAIELDSEQALWAAGSYGRISRYRYGQWIEIGETDEEIETERWRCAYADDSGVIYFGSANGLIVWIREGEILKERIPSALPSNAALAAIEDSAGCRYVAVGSQLLSLPSEATSFELEAMVGPVLAMAISPSGELWCSNRWGVFRKDGRRFIEVPLDIRGETHVISSMVFEPNGYLWAGTDRGEVLKFDGRTWLRLGESDELTGGPIDRILRVGSGRVWALSQRSGISGFDGRRWEKFPLSWFNEQPLSDAAVDSAGRLFVAGWKGVWRYDRDSGWNLLELPPIGTDVNLTRIRFDHMGRTYVGTSEGLWLIGAGSVQYIQPQDGFEGRDVSVILLDSEGLIWIGFRKDGLSLIPMEQLW